jgi:tRNA A58 N-methylase Trm61
MQSHLGYGGASSIQRWYRQDGKRFLQSLGIRRDFLVLDYGCGSGNYSIPAAEVVGARGRVLALDRSSYSLQTLRRTASSYGLDNLVPIRTLEEATGFMGERLLDAVLLFDVIHSYYFTAVERRELLESLAPLMRSGALVCLYPRHMDSREIEDVVDRLGELGIAFERAIESRLIHDGSETAGRVLVFRKQKGEGSG